MRVIFLHGLESTVDAAGVPIGRKAQYLRQRFDAVGVALDTSAAQAVARREVERTGGWTWPYDGYEAAFETPLARARAALTDDVRLVVASSFGGAVALRLLHESGWDGPVLFLAGAGPKLTPHRTLPDVPALLVHGTQDTVVPPQDSVELAATSPTARVLLVEDDHRLTEMVNDASLGRWVEELLGA
ncbi:MAG: hypothetical protein GY913_10505 [Proteobacteria bacterium]|nr:hypothetical protein [Pseudomonadota bacterium]MCP4917344.1 hypothetical protein [Pseudomonadota bacterium]